ncbi:MAG: ATP-binding cassette domain-containing protein [Bauldia sp.]|nr:ATP-binding cassette domain-containing protein [Bauldia sp.]
MLVLDRLALTWPDFSVLYDLAVPRGALCSLIGPSGGGKTTLLQAVAGFARPVSGSVSFDGVDLTRLPPADRPLTILFQEHNLFPHLTAAQNIGLGLDPRLRLTALQQRQVEEALARVDLAGLGRRRPAELSGGQRQRVAIARAIVRDKPLMLLDEPFTGLDPGLRQDMIALVDTLRRERGLTVLMAIHTPADAATVSELMAFIDEGRVAAVGPPAEVLAMRIPALDRYFRR